MKSILLKPLYSRALNGLPLLGTPEEVARRFSRAGEGSADRLIALYTSLSGATGFVFGLPGILLTPVTVPANLTGVALLQLHMTAALAALAGEDLRDRKTRERCIDCLLERKEGGKSGTGEEEVQKRTAVKLAERGVRYLATRTIGWAGKRARRALFGRLGAKRIPILGGFLSGGSDAYMTAAVGRCARSEFIGDA